VDKLRERKGYIFDYFNIIKKIKEGEEKAERERSGR